MGIEKHLVGLQQIGRHDEGPAEAQLKMCDLQVGAHLAEYRPILAPVELKGLSRGEG